MNPFEVAPTPTGPSLPGSVVLRADVDEVVDAIAADLTIQAKNCVRAFGDFHLALSGGSTPQPLYRRLMYDPSCRDLPWKRTHLWIVDERCVPFEDKRSNFGVIRSLIVEHADIPQAQVHPILATRPEAAEEYERELERNLGWREKGHDRLDFVVLGMGDDAHTASLFPHSPALSSGDRLATFNEGDTVVPPKRVTMTYRLLNASRFLALMVTGSGKRETINKVSAAHQNGFDVAEFPVLGLDPVGGTLRWYLDRTACPEV